MGEWHYGIDEAAILHPCAGSSTGETPKEAWREAVTDTIVLRNMDRLARDWLGEGRDADPPPFAQVLFTNICFWKTIDHGAVLSDGRILLVEAKAGKPGPADLKKLSKDVAHWRQASGGPRARLPSGAGSKSADAREKACGACGDRHDGKFCVQDLVRHTHGVWGPRGKHLKVSPAFTDHVDWHAKRELAGFYKDLDRERFKRPARHTRVELDLVRAASEVMGLGRDGAEITRRHELGMGWRKPGHTASDILPRFESSERFRIVAVLLTSGVDEGWVKKQNGNRSANDYASVKVINYEWTAAHPEHGYPTAVHMRHVGDLLL